MTTRIPVIDVTDLYHPAQDPGDNLDILTPFCLPEIDLRAVILDVTDKYRQPVADHGNPEFCDRNGPRDPGFIPLLQLQYLFGRQVPIAAGPFTPLRSPADEAADAPAFQRQGIELILRTLRESREKVHIVSFGSTRTIAAAYNRDQELFHSKVEQLHLSAGASSVHFLEWNVALDPHAFVCLLRSTLPIALYPCATEAGPFAYGPNSSFWKLPQLDFVRDMEPRLRRYLGFALGRLVRMDFLRALDEELPEEVMENVYRLEHNVWETAVWAQVSGRCLVRSSSGGRARLVPKSELLPEDVVLPGELRPCTVRVEESGAFQFAYTEENTNFMIYERGDAAANEAAMREALPDLYRSFRI